MESRIQRLNRIIDDMQGFKKIISDDPDEQTAMIESYRYFVIHLKELSHGLVPKEIADLIEKIDDDFEDVYELYRAIAYVDVILPDIKELIENHKIEKTSYNQAQKQGKIEIQNGRVFLVIQTAIQS